VPIPPPTGGYTPHTETAHLSHRSNWLRAAVLGANDGILSIAGLLLGVVGSGASSAEVVTAGVAGVVAGAISMGAGEYVSVSSQRDTETADLHTEETELKRNPDGELRELVDIYRGRGLDDDLALAVAQQLSSKDALGAHVRDELGLSDVLRARPLQAAGSSAAAFTAGAALPMLAAILASGGIGTNCGSVFLGSGASATAAGAPGIGIAATTGTVSSPAMNLDGPPSTYPVLATAVPLESSRITVGFSLLATMIASSGLPQ